MQQSIGIVYMTETERITPEGWNQPYSPEQDPYEKRSVHVEPPGREIKLTNLRINSSEAWNSRKKPGMYCLDIHDNRNY